MPGTLGTYEAEWFGSILTRRSFRRIEIRRFLMFWSAVPHSLASAWKA